MKRLFVVSTVLRALTTAPGTSTTKQTLSYRASESADEALGLILRITMETYPDWAVQSYVITEIIPEHVASIFHDQAGLWEFPTIDPHLQPGASNEQVPTPSSV